MRPARAIMADLAATGMTPDQIALVMELSAAVTAEARPVIDESAERRRERDRDYQAQKRAERRQTSADSGDVDDAPALSRPPNEINSNPPTHTHPDIQTPRVRKADDFPMLDCSDQQTWVDFLRNRKAKRLPCTATAHAKLIADLDKWTARTGWPPGDVFAACVGKGWGAIYDPRDDDNGRNERPQRASKPTTREIGQDLVQSILRRTGDSRTDSLLSIGPPGGHVSG